MGFILVSKGFCDFSCNGTADPHQLVFEGAGWVMQHNVGASAFESATSGGTDRVAIESDGGDIEMRGEVLGQFGGKGVVGEDLPDAFGERTEQRKSCNSSPRSLEGCSESDKASDCVFTA